MKSLNVYICLSEEDCNSLSMHVEWELPISVWRIFCISPSPFPLHTHPLIVVVVVLPSFRLLSQQFHSRTTATAQYTHAASAIETISNSKVDGSPSTMASRSNVVASHSKMAASSYMAASHSSMAGRSNRAASHSKMVAKSNMADSHATKMAI